jgi:hypothetical protein
MRYFLGLDLGQASDFSALAVLERPLVQRTDPPGRQRPAYGLRLLRRYPLGTAYPAIVEDVRDLLRRPPLPGSVLGVDQTGVGRPVVDMLADALRGKVTCRLCPITITGGHAFTAAADGGVHVPKKDLVGAVQALLSDRRLKVPRTLPEAPLLVQELENFRVKITAAAHEQFGAWRERDHDDLVLAVALAAWLGETALPPPGKGTRGPGPRRLRV